MTCVLVVEDDEAIAEPLVRSLRRDGYDVLCVTTGEGALSTIASTVVDLVVVDLGLPDIDGVDVCRRIRRTQHQLPIVIVTARSEELDAVLGLDSGADDYVTKPFRTSELLARVRSRLRVALADIVAVRDLRLDRGERRLWRAGDEIAVTTKEFELLDLLVANAGRVVTRDVIMREVWDEHFVGSTKTLDMHVSWLRRKLGDDAGAPHYIATVRGVGLRFEVR